MAEINEVVGSNLIQQSTNELSLDGEAQPLVDDEAQPLVDGEDQPLVDGEDQPLVDGEAQPLVDGEAQPLVDGEAQPLVDGEAQPLVDGEAQPLIDDDEDQPLIDGEVQPILGSGTQPLLGGESIFNNEEVISKTNLDESASNGDSADPEISQETSEIQAVIQDKNQAADVIKTSATAVLTNKSNSGVIERDGVEVIASTIYRTGDDSRTTQTTPDTLTVTTTTVADVNNAPVAVDDVITATEDTPFTSTVDLDFNDTDLDLDALTVTAGTFATTAGGSIVLAADGSYTYTPLANFNGTDTVDYTVTDGTATDTGTLTITVGAVTDAFTDGNETDSTNEDTAITNGNLFSDLADTDSTSHSITTFTIDGSATTHAAGAAVTIAGKGDLTIKANGTYDFTPVANFNGTVPTATYVIQDNNDTSDTDTSTLDITVNAALSFAISSTPSISEDAEETATFSVAMTGTLATGETASVDLTPSGTATDATDHAAFMTAVATAATTTTGVTLVGNTLTFDSTAASPFTFTMAAIDDADVEGTETIIGTLSGATTTNGAVSILTPVTTTNITENDATLSFAISSTASISEDAAETATFSVAMTGTLATGETASVDLTPSGTATDATDHTAFMTAVATAAATTTGVTLVGNTLTFDSTAASPFTFTMAAIDDADVEGTETIIGTLSGATTTNGAVSILTPVTTTNITENDATLSFAISSTASISEDAAETATFSVAMTGTLSTGETASVVLTPSGTATDATDHTEFMTAVATAAANTTGVTLSGNTLTFDSTAASAFTFTMDAIDDADVEGTETIIGTLSGATTTNGTVAISTAETTTNITENDAALSFAISSTASISEDTQETATFNVAMSGTLVAGETASVVLTPTGTATGSTDYADFMAAVAVASANTTGVTLSGNTLTFDSTAASVFTFTMDAIDDSDVEGTETIIGTLSGATTTEGTVAISTASTTTNITEDEATLSSTVSITGDAAVWEGNTATYTVSTDTQSSSPISVVVQTTQAVANPATGGVDYVTVNETVIIPANTNSATFTVQTTDDALADSGENFVAEIVSATGSEFESVAVDVNASSVDTVIVDASEPNPPSGIPGTPDTPDAGGTVSITGDISVNEGAQASYIVHTDTISTSDIIVTVTTGHVTTDAGDYTAITQDITIPAGSLSSVAFSVQTIDDNVAEATEAYSVSITAASGNEFESVAIDGSANSVNTNIVDNDASTLSINDQSVNEEAGTMEFTVTLSNPSISTVTVEYNTANGTSTAGLDYTATTGTLTFTPGQLTQTISVPVSDDFIDEGSETLDMILSNPSGATITDGTGLGIIQDEPILGAEDTINVTLSGDIAVKEGGTASYTVTLSETAITNMDVVVATGHTTTENGDLIPTNMTVTVLAGTNSIGFTVANIDDAYAEGDETYNVTLSGITTGGEFEVVNVDNTPVSTVISDNTTPGTEANDDVINVVLSGATTVAEGGTATYTITLDEPTATAMQVEVQTGHTTTEDGDLIPTTMMVDVPEGASSVNFTVSNNQDTNQEGNEDYTVSLTGTTTGGGFETLNVVQTPLTTTIIDDDVLSISINDVTVNEDAGTMIFTVSLSTDTTSDVTFDFASADNASALAGRDYTAVTGSGTITAGTTTTTITVSITDDYVAESPEAFLMNLTNVSGGVVVADAQGLGTITDEGTPSASDTVTVSIAGASDVNEGNSATYTVSADKAVETDMTVDVTYSYSTAQTGDVTTNTVQVTILAGETTSPLFSVSTIDDAYLEGNEVYNVTISNPQGGGVEKVVLGTDTVATTIQDGTSEDDGGTGTADTATVSIVGDAGVIEGASAAYTISVDKAPTEDMTVDVTYSYTSAESGDIVTTTTSVTISANSLSTPLNIATIDDAYAEGDEVYVVNISNPSAGGFENIVLGTDSVSTTISDNTTPGTEANNDVINVVLSGATTVAEGGTAIYTVTLDEPTVIPMDVQVQTGHTTTDNGDLVPTIITVTIPIGTTEKTFTVANNQDTTLEGNEDYTVALNGTTNGGGFETVNVVQTPLTTTIIDDEGIPSLIINDVTVDEDLGTMTFAVSLSSSTTSDVTFDFASVDNASALAGSDYTAVAGSGTILAGATTTIITVPITDDYIAENPETFVMNLSNPSANAQIADGQGLGTITDEVTPSNPTDTVTLTLTGTADVEESTTASYTVTADKAPATDLTVTIKTGHVDTVTGDYVETDTTVTIPAGQTFVNFTIQTNDDAYAEGGENYTVTMSDPIGGGVEAIALGTSVVTTTINDETSPASEDTATVSISGATTVIEGEVATYTVSVDKTPITDLVITIQTGHTTTEAGDFTVPTFTTVTIPANSTSVDFTIASNDDALAEGTEGFTVSLTGTSGGGFENTIIGVSGVTTAITDNDAIDFAISSTPSISEDTAETATFSVAMTGTLATGETASVDLTPSGSATDATDHAAFMTAVATAATAATGVTLSGNTLTFDSTAASAFAFTIAAIDDADFEGTETIIGTLSGATTTNGTATISTVSTTTEITNNDPTVDFAIASTPSIDEATQDTATFTITLDSVIDAGNTASVDVTPSGTATDSTDYADFMAAVASAAGATTGVSLVSNTLTFDSTFTSPFTFTIAAIDDATVELTESIIGTLSTATVSNGTATISTDSTITNITEAPIIISVGDAGGFTNNVTVDEGALAVFLVTLSKAPLTATSFALGLTNGDALVDDDYVALTNTTNGTDNNGDPIAYTDAMKFSNGVTLNPDGISVSVPEGVASFAVMVRTVDGALEELTETFNLNVGGLTGIGTILDNDAPPTINHIGDASGSVNNVTVLEGISAVFTVSLSHVTTEIGAYDLALTNGSAILTSDYTNDMVFSDGVTYDSITGQISIPIGVTSFTVTVPTTNDAVHEPTEAFTLSIGDVGGANTVEGTGTITDNDAAPTITHVGDGSINNITVAEGVNAVFTVNLSGTSWTDTSFALALNNGSANLVEDYTDGNTLLFSDGVTYNTTTGEISVPAGVTSFTVTVPTVDDTQAEPTETFILSVGGVAGIGNITDGDSGTPTVNNIPGAQDTPEDVSLVFSTDNGNPITVANDVTTTTISIASGTLTATTFTGATITNNGNDSVTITGTAAAINGALDGLIYAGTADYNGSMILSVTSTGSAVTTGNVAINMTPVVDITDDSVAYTPTSTGFCDTVPVTDTQAALTTTHDTFTIGSTSTDTVIHGLGGNDTITTTSTGASNNSIVTLEGNDIITTTTVEGKNVICAGDGDNTITTTVTGTGGNFVEMGKGNDTMTTTNVDGHNTILAGDGNNTITTTTTGTGNTKVVSGTGNDTITTTNVVFGTSTVLSGAGNDTVSTGAGADLVVSGSGNDTVTTTGGADIVLSGAGNDTVSTGEGSDIILSAAGNDIIAAAAGNDIIFSGSGDDRINAAGGADIIDSGSGDDIIWLGTVDGAEDVVIFGSTAAANGIDAITQFTSGSDKLNLSAMTTQTATTEVTGNLTVTAGNVYFFNAAGATDASTVSLSAIALDGGATWNNASNGTVAFFIVSAGNGSAIYQYTEDGSVGVGINVAKLTLMGTIDDTITTSDLVFEANALAAAGLAEGLAGLASTQDTPSVSSLTINVLANDTFNNAVQTITAVNGSAITEGGAAVAVANGSVKLVNAELVFTPTLVIYTGIATFTYTVMSGGVSETSNVNVNVNNFTTGDPVAPVNTVPDAQYTLLPIDTLVFNTINGNAITVADADSTSLTTTLSVASGTLTAQAFAGATITSNGTGSVTIAGTAAAINGALNGLIYDRVDTDLQTQSLTVVTSDGTLTDSDVIALVLPTHVGTEGIDAITVAAGDNNVILGLGSNDAITMGAGANNLVFGGDGNDALTIGAGDSTIYGGAGDDTFAIGVGNKAFGGLGNDIFNGAAGDFIVDGGAGNDSITLAAGNSTVSGGDGDDTITIASGNSIISGGAGADTIVLGAGLGTVDGGIGNDIITAGAGAFVYGGDGDDTLNLTTINIAHGGTGNNSFIGAAGAFNITALAGDDTVTFGAGNHTIDVGEGINTLNLGAGNTTITSGAGIDNITTGAGDFIINAGDGDNVIWTGAAATGGSTTSTGSGNDTITTGGGVQTINSGEGNDTITTSTGVDTITGGAGDDTMTGGTAADVFKWGAGETGSDVITDFTLAGGGDVLDLADLLVGGPSDALSLDDYLNFSDNGAGETLITVDTNGLASGGEGQTITLENITYASWGTTSDTDIITQMLVDNLVV
jgi:Ca2+-binding RTX toxin-like protein